MKRDTSEALPERVLALLEKHGGWQATLDYIAKLEAAAVVDDAAVARAREAFDEVMDAEDAAERMPLMDRLDKGFRAALTAALASQQAVKP